MSTAPSYYGKDIDAFIAEYIPENRREVATAQLCLITMKALRQGMEEAKEIFSPSAK